MTKFVGTAFAFYVKYWEQMRMLYKPESGKVERPLPKREDMQRLEAVGARAYEQAAMLIKECSKELEAHFNRTGICKVNLSSRERKIERDWYAELKLRLNGTRAKRTRRYAGVSIDRGRATPGILLWLWVPGGRAAEEGLARKLGALVIHRSGDIPDWQRGSLFIAEIPIRLDNHKRFEIELEPILTQVRKALTRFDRKKVRLFLEN